MEKDADCSVVYCVLALLAIKSWLSKCCIHIDILKIAPFYMLLLCSYYHCCH